MTRTASGSSAGRSPARAQGGWPLGAGRVDAADLDGPRHPLLLSRTAALASCGDPAGFPGPDVTWISEHSQIRGGKLVRVLGIIEDVEFVGQVSEVIQEPETRPEKAPRE